MRQVSTPEPAVSPPPWLWPRAAYVHVPFCARRCGYCDFAIAVGHDDLIDRYLDALAAELATLGEPQPVRTLFLGGGTPTHLSARQLERLLADVLRWLPLPGVRGQGSGVSEGGESSLTPDPCLLTPEFSVEANPGTLDDDKVAVLARNSQALFLVQRTRDEAHRFAITYHKQLRSKRGIASAMDSVPGIGPKRKRLLLRRFGSVKAIREAPVEELAAVPGMTLRLAEKLKEYL